MFKPLGKDAEFLHHTLVAGKEENFPEITICRISAFNFFNHPFALAILYSIFFCSFWACSQEYLSKVAEQFVVADHLRPSILKKIRGNQFGAIPESSTTHALISMVHSWTKHTDGTASTVRVLLFDYRKAFDLIDHALLAGKLLALDMPIGVSFWIIDFLTDRTQRVKLGEDCLSEWRNAPAGVPQRIKLGQWLFILMIDDINTSNTELWKYVDYCRVCWQEGS